MQTVKKNPSRKLVALASGAVMAVAFAAPAAHAGPVVGGSVAPGGAFDYASAIPMPLPQSPVAPIYDSDEWYSENLGTPGFAPGALGNGQLSAVRIPVGEGSVVGADDDIGSQEYGTSNHPFTTNRVDMAATNGTTNSLPNGTSLRYPYRATGKLYFTKPGVGNFICSASLIKRGIIVTAAHCVANYGKKQFYTNFQYHPARYDAFAPYGVWTVNGAWVMTAYFNGTDVCAPGATGVVCRNDIAVLRVTPKPTNPTYPGTATGWYGYGWNGYGFTPNNQALFNQLGYPAALDGGLKMQRTDSQAFVSTSMAGNSVWGGLQTGGSSGGPELVNLGIAPALSGGISFGAEASRNIVVGVTSWGYTNQAIKQQGASPFLSTNIVPLVNAACAAPTPFAACH